MKRRYSRPLWASVLAAAAAWSHAATAVEFGAFRSLQRGPIGDSPQFADIDRIDAEGLVEMTRSYGSYQMNGDSETKVSADYFKSRVAVGGGWEPTKSFTLTGYADSTLYSSYTEEQSRAAADAKLNGGLYHHELSLFGVYKAHPLVFGASIGLLLIGSETKEFDTGGIAIKEQIGSAAMPLLRIFGGFTTKTVDASLGFRLFSQGNAVVKETETGAKDHEFDVNRKNPGELYADGRLKFAEATIAATLAYVFTAQASEQLDEFSARYGAVNGHETRVTGLGVRDNNTVRIGVGGRFDPVKIFGLLGGVTYTGASYASAENVSLEENNLGGVRFDLGSDLHIQTIRGFFRSSYTLGSKADYTQPDANRSTGNLDRTLRPPVNQNDSVSATAGSWSLLLGGGVAL